MITVEEKVQQLLKNDPRLLKKMLLPIDYNGPRAEVATKVGRLKEHGFKYIGDIAFTPSSEICDRIYNFGKVSLWRIEDYVLKPLRLYIDMPPIQGWPSLDDKDRKQIFAEANRALAEKRKPAEKSVALSMATKALKFDSTTQHGRLKVFRPRHLRRLLRSFER